MKKLLLLIMLAFSGSAWSACTTTVAVNGDVNAALQNATGGDIVCLAYDTSGGINYISLGAISKTPAVILTSKEVEDNISPFRFSKINLTTGQTNSATGITIKKMAFLHMDFFNNGNNYYISILDNVNLPPVSGVNSFMRFVGDGDVNTNSHNLIKGNTFTGVNAAGNIAEGRLYLSWGGTTVVEGNTFNGNGCSDGIQMGGIGGIIRGNLFENLHQGSCDPEHVDAIQIHDDTYADDITIEDNIFRDVTVGIGAYKFSNNLTVRNNVFNQGSCGSECRVVLDFGSASNLVFKNNYVNTDAMRVGTINQCAPSSSIEAKENVFTNNSGFNLTQKGGCSEPALSSYVVTHNLYPAVGNALDSAPILGTPILASTTPTILTDFALKSTSPGYGATPLIGITGVPTPFVAPSGAIAEFLFENNILDSSTNLNHGIANGAYMPSFGTGVSGQAGVFNQSSPLNLVTIPFSSTTNISSLSISVWINSTENLQGIPSTPGRVIMAKQADESSSRWNMQAHGGGAGQRPYSFISATTGAISIQPSNGAPPSCSVTAGGVWQHLVMTYNHVNGMHTMYVDGVQCGQANRPDNIPVKTGFGTLWIGGTLYGMGERFKGSIDSLRIYNRELTATEVSTLYSEL